MQRLKLFFLAIICILSILNSCRNDNVYDGAEIPLEFSLDTLRFDTVFTEVGSITRWLKVYNELDEAVLLDKIEIASGETSKFRMNVDGLPGNEIENVRVEPQDSIYIFVEVTIDPDAPLSISPFVIEDQIRIKANSSEYTIYLEAWGQNANYIPNRNAKGLLEEYECFGGVITWDDPKPYVIYGILALNGCTLEIKEGTKVYVHGGVAINDVFGVINDGIIVVLGNSRIEFNGTAENPITFNSDRLEEDFAETKGQWAGILIQSGSRGNTIKHTKIRHSIVGLSVDSAAQVTIENCEFGLTSGSGLSASHATVTATNSLFYENETSGLSLGYGGNYEFIHCTIANYNNQGSALSASNFRCTDPLCQEEILFNALRMSFDNCIFSGNDEDELTLVDVFDGEQIGSFQYDFNNCIVTVEELLEEDNFPDFLDDCTDCLTITRRDTLYVDQNEHDFHLDSLSLAIDKGRFIPSFDTDLDGLPRETSSPDIGCYEYQK